MPNPICNYEQVCLRLVNAEDEAAVLSILADTGLDDPRLWIPLGGIENNLSIAGNQQSTATAALVEKLVNSIDSLLVREALLRGIDPESPEAPQSMTEASMALFGVPDGNIARLAPHDRARLAETVQLIATGSKREPCYTIVDLGEGQRSTDFGNTFCSLVRSNKLRIPFVQGKFNMGGCGVLAYCGRHNMQLIVSRRHPQLLNGHEAADSGWGWTVIRRFEPRDGRRSSFYEYLAPDGQVPGFCASTLPIRATAEAAYGGPLEWGTLIKLYNYQSEFPSAVTLDLNYELSRRLYQLPLPVRLLERRDYRAHSKGTILTGMSVRLEDDRAGVLDPNFPDSGVIHVEDVGDVPIEVIVFKKGEGRNFLSPNAAILFTVNGQVHGALHRRFCSRQQVQLDYLRNDLMVVLNCSGITARVREDLFMPSRDRLRECTAKKSFEGSLERYLSEHIELQRLNRNRREEELRNRLADDKPLTEALKSVIEGSPELRKLFQLGLSLPSLTVPGERQESFVGLRFPTFFRLKRKPKPGEVCEIECVPGDTARVHFVTDAANDYFTRASEPGTLKVSPHGLFDQILLRNGRAILTVKCPVDLALGATVEVAVEVTDPSRTRPLVNLFRLRVVEESVKAEPRDTVPPPSKSGALALPKIVEIDEAGWPDEEFRPDSGLTMHRDIDGGLVAKVNVANQSLQQFLARTPDPERDLTRKRFIYGLVLAGVSLWSQYADDERADELIRSSTAAIARVLLPTIVVLGSLEESCVTIA